MWYYRVIKRKDWVELVEWYDLDGKQGWTDPILIADDIPELLANLEQMRLDVINTPAIPESELPL